MWRSRKVLLDLMNYFALLILKELRFSCIKLDVVLSLRELWRLNFLMAFKNVCEWKELSKYFSLKKKLKSCAGLNIYKAYIRELIILVVNHCRELNIILLTTKSVLKLLQRITTKCKYFSPGPLLFVLSRTYNSSSDPIFHYYVFKVNWIMSFLFLYFSE